MSDESGKDTVGTVNENETGEEDRVDTVDVAVACQGGGSHTAFTAGVLGQLLEDIPPRYNLVGMSGTSGGAVCALLGWYGFIHPEKEPRTLLSGFWDDLSASSPPHRTANTLVRMDIELRRMGFMLPEVSPAYSPASWWGQNELRRLLEKYVDFDEIPELLDGTEPALLVSAIDVLAGSFEIFREDGISADAVLASAAEPHIFNAVEVDGRYYWDGLFSKNPPLKDFLAEPDVPDPDEIWLVQINPHERTTVPRTLEEIGGRRNELAGNISLSAEIRFLESVNRWIEKGYLPESFTYTEIRHVRFPQRRRLDWRTKLDRDPAFLSRLVNEGEESAERFLKNV
ncbi:MAG: patatin-like phospholipase family protein [Halobacteriales archaeon]|nr:patatin-like phospholipase family protein [Halobacteriales archaeon]